MAVYTIPAETPFLDALADGLLAQFFDPRDPASLAAITVLLPTRRATRALGEALLTGAVRRGLAPALMLPQIRPIGDVDEEALVLEDSDDALALPQALPSLRARLLLTRLVAAREGDRLNAGQAARLAASLEQFLERCVTYGADPAALDTLVPAAFSGHWQETLEFLRILTDRWPDVLAAEGAVTAAARRDALLAALTERWRKTPPDAPVIAAGSTGTIPATARLLSVVAALPKGMVVLPGLDLTLDERAWALVDERHPQGAMKALLRNLERARDDVMPWPYEGARGSCLRGQLVREALRPAEATEAWRADEAGLGAALSAASDDNLALHYIEAPHSGLEAETIALILRGALEQPDARAALVTPDRALATRVLAALQRFGLTVDDSAGMPLAGTQPGIFLRLLAAAVSGRLAPVPLLALLKHPLASLGLAPGEARRQARLLESALFRGPAPGGGLEGLRKAAQNREGILRLLDRLERCLSPFLLVCYGAEPPSLSKLARAHVEAAEALARSDTEAGARRLWAGEAGEAAAAFFADLIAQGEPLESCPSADYPAVIEALLEGRVVRPRAPRHPRLFIWGPLEARLQHVDTIVLGGLNEGVWPPEASVDPWLSRPMAKALGLPSPEQRLGLAAHDFAQAASSARRVYLTRAEKVDGAPAVASRWLVRLQTLLAGFGKADLLAPDRPWLEWAQLQDKPEGDLAPAAPPEPCPPLAARPRKLSVTQIETLLRDPYALYARQVLRLKPLEGLDTPPGAAERGILLHAIFQRFTQEGIDAAAPDACARLIALAKALFDEQAVPDAVRAIWWPRFCAAANVFIADERAWLAQGARSIAAECEGKATFDSVGGLFTLTARADRIDRMTDGTLAIFDYKSGRAPTYKEAKSGFAPQLPLEAMIALAGGFTAIEAGPVTHLGAIRITHRNEERRAPLEDPAMLAADASRNLRARIADYDDPQKAYHARIAVMFAKRREDYDHLSRVKEWGMDRDNEEDALP